MTTTSAGTMNRIAQAIFALVIAAALFYLYGAWRAGCERQTADDTAGVAQRTGSPAGRRAGEAKAKVRDELADLDQAANEFRRMLDSVQRELAGPPAKPQPSATQGGPLSPEN